MSIEIPIANPLIGDEEIKEVVDVLKSGFIAQGPKVKEFEEEFAKYIGTKYAIATSSGTTALHTALLAIGVTSGDEIITTPFSFAATGNSILFTGARPVFVDIDPKTFNIDPEKIEDAITDNTKAIMPVQLYGQSVDMDPIMEIAKDHNLKVVEDAAQAHGALYKEKKVGNLGDIACFSFYPTKNMTTSEGGIITTNNKELADIAQSIRAHGESKRYEHYILGYNFRMTDISAAIGIAQLNKLDTFNNKRIANAEFLNNNLKDIDGIVTPKLQDDSKHVYHQYTIKVEKGNRDDWIRFLNDNGVGTGIHYPIPIYKQELYQNLGYTDRLLESERAANTVISLPIHPSVTKDNLNKIINVLKEASDKFS
ncbi:DegT/DnrJ/EryC1/StrS family aminotransferase [Methanobrevibacter filiformis]|uniref:UDP-2-acetamido-2-deoxy-3-oxo-D-glucuronate aminotransferase n=1 Tax=Methanobrevibacter filiformis TaxID=55758 RepID=A0A166BQQ3_9EURY|nr:DegT/DnrJ/EryC1/StrS family aminotransferase [Methanobrevibacter filiformis]KZX13689.1 UDP-2-acetamido-2-deoxy-3-oxo-D-glucuronate aminotransferase [Methanobrevibacter filiformis]